MEQENSKLWEAYCQAPTSHLKGEIVKRYLPLVRYVAGRMVVSAPPGLDFEDLLSFGSLGLLDAIDRFELDRGFCFQTFAVPRIRGAILDELRRYDWISRSGREKLQKLDRAMDEIARTSGHSDDETLMALLDMDEKGYRELLEIAGRSYVVSLDEVLSFEEGEIPREELLEDDSPDPLEMIEQAEEAERVTRALESLSERERLLLTLYYYEGLTLKEIGKVLGVTESRVSQLHGKSLSLLRALLKNQPQ